MKFTFTFILILILSILLGSCTIHKKRYSRGYTIERNNTFRSNSKNTIKHEKSIVSEIDKTIETETISQELTLTEDHNQTTPQTIKDDAFKDEGEELFNSNINSVEKESKSKKARITPTKSLRKIKHYITPTTDREDNNTFGILALAILIIGIITVLLSILSIAPFALTSLIVIAGLAALSFYILTLKSFKEIRTKKIRNRWISIVNFSIISLLLIASIFGLFILGLFSLFYLEIIFILLILAGILLLALLFFIALFSFIKSMKSRK